MHIKEGVTVIFDNCIWWSGTTVSHFDQIRMVAAGYETEKILELRN